MDGPGAPTDDATQPPHLLRRRVLLAGGLVGAATVVGGGVGVARGDLPGRPWLSRHLGLNGPPGQVPDEAVGPMVGDSFISRARRGARCTWAVSYPPGAPRGMPVVVVLHGRGAEHASAFGTHMALDRFQARTVAGRAAPFAVASVDGGDTYWHRRASGEDAGATVVDELLPLLSRRGLDTRRNGLFGWSMGGYGALLLAGRLGRDRVAAVVAESPALWHRSADTAAGALDDAADFRTHTLFGHERDLTGIPVRIDCGTGDPFYPAARDYVDALSPRPAGGFQPGGHDPDYWRRMAPQQLAFLAAHLSPPG